MSFEQTFQEEDGDICRVCRNGPTPDNQLSYPCKCSGSIKYIHKQCLLEWIQHSKSSSCELCGHPFRFTPIYSENAPEFIPLSELVFEAMIRLKWYIKRFARIIYIIFCWLFVVPVVTCWIFHFYFGKQWFLSAYDRKADFTVNSFIYDFFIGTMLFFWILFATVVSYVILDFIHHKHSEIDIQNEMMNYDIQQIQQQMAANNNQMHQHQQQQPVQPLFQNNNESDSETESDDSDQELIPNNVNEAYNQLPQQQQQQQQPQIQQPQQPQARVIFRIPAVFDILRGEDQPIQQQLQQLQQQQQQPQPQQQAQVNDININNNIDDDGNDDIEHFIGLSGPLSNIITNCIILVLFNAAFILVFLYLPFLLGQFVQELTLTKLEMSIFLKGSLDIFIGYAVFSITSLLFLSFLISKNIWLKFTVLLYSFIKVVIITVVELGFLPILIGMYIDFSSLSLFGSSISSRFDYFMSNKLPFLITRWGFGIFFMLNFTYLLSTLHQIFRKGVLWFVRDPDDPDFDLVKDMIKSSFQKHLFKISFSVFAYIFASTLLVYLPSKALSLIPNLLPINIDFGQATNKSTSDVIFIYAISYFPRIDARVTIKNVTKFWVKEASNLLKLDGYLLPQPAVPSNQATNNNEANSQAAAVVVKPDNFGLRISTFIFMGWLSLFLIISTYLSLPVIIGRYLLGPVSGNDIYSIILGLITIWIAGKSIYILVSNGSSINLLQWSIILLKIIFISICCLILIPILTGILLDLIFFIPLTTPYDETLHFDYNEKFKILFQYWCSGALILQFWYRCVTAANYNPNNIRNNRPEDLERPRDKWIDRFEVLKRNGFANINVKYTLTKVVFPIGHYLLTLFTVPYCISKFVIPYFGGTLTLESIAFRYGFPVYCFILIAEKLFMQIKSWILIFNNAIRDDRYLIGKHLHNLDESKY
ncbi:RING zinc finger-containing protein [Tieghemostelium lacteum]|uniref:RING-type E3 ubiquitin transferase n=1 Tax=Tieghemostelium lacteum TaxID=361077 RepID=A0A152A3J6_TIELA|nr:RING zinc finger-containing protein [Tieghemostelium lacteum]|eukprot:KYR00667.1 RING zinc finger-containing protein [Tieghemostelium lacteum]